MAVTRSRRKQASAKAKLTRQSAEERSLEPSTETTLPVPASTSETTYLGRHPGLFDPANSQSLQVGVDFGTDNSSAVFAVVDGPEDKILRYADRIHVVRALDEYIRLPTIAAFKADDDDPTTGLLIFAFEAVSALHQGDTRVEKMIFYPKLGLIDDFGDILEAHQTGLQELQLRQIKTIDSAKMTFSTVKIQYHDGTEEKVSALNSIDDVIVYCLKYFLAEVKAEMSRRLGIASERVEELWTAGSKVQVGFAAPSFWKDSMLDNFMRLIQRVGWPTWCKIWSEPKCALSAHVVQSFANLSERQRDIEKTALLTTVYAVMDIGGGSSDSTTLRVTEITEDTIKFACIAESGGSMCGGRLLNDNVAAKLKEMLGDDLVTLLDNLSAINGSQTVEQDLLQYFDYDKSRRNFSGNQQQYPIEYGGSNLPSAQYTYMTPRAAKLPKKEMREAHNAYVEVVIVHIKEQISKTRKAIGGEPTKIQVVLLGGVTRSPYVVQRIRAHLADQPDLAIVEVEDGNRPLTAVGCIICLGQPSIGRHFAAKEAYGIPVAQLFHPARHRLGNRVKDERADKGTEARDITYWIKKVTESGEPYTADPREEHETSAFWPLRIRQDILSTSSPIYGKLDDLEYTQVHQITLKNQLVVELDKNQCLQIDKNWGKKDKVGFWRDRKSKQWFFITCVRAMLSWHDVRTTWRAEIPKTGVFDDEDQVGANDVWHKEVTFTSIDRHGVREGDEGDEDGFNASAGQQ